MDGAPPIEAKRNTWGGRRTGAGAPRGNRNAVRKTARNRAFEAYRNILKGDLFAALPPAVRELLSIALGAALERALAEAAANTAGLSEAEVDRAQRLASATAGQLLVAAFTGAWISPYRSRDQREASVVRVLRPWLDRGMSPGVTPIESSQSSDESGLDPSIKNNQAPLQAPHGSGTPAGTSRS